MRRVDDLIRRHLTPDAALGLEPALAIARSKGEDVIAISPAFADRAGLLVLTPDELVFVAADASDQAVAHLGTVASCEVSTYDDRPVMVLLGEVGRTLFYLGDAAWTATFAAIVNLALDEPGAARVAADQHAGGASSSGGGAPGASTRERLAELDGLRRDGVITEAEYAVKRAAILDAL